MAIIVLHHGLMGFDTLGVGPARVHYWDGIGPAIAGSGHTVIVTQVHPTAGISRRAEQLKSQMLTGLHSCGSPGAKVAILAHSLGGLDARYMITHLGMADRVAALVTLSSPHHGSPWYDYLTGRLGGVGRVTWLRDALVDVRAFWEVTVPHSLVFNERVPDVPGVRYYSIGAVCPQDRIPLGLGLAHRVIFEAQGDNDGLVSAYSARWGTDLGTWPFHHLHLVNWPLRLLSPAIHEDVRPRYLQLLATLAVEGAIESPPARPQLLQGV